MTPGEGPVAAGDRDDVLLAWRRGEERLYPVLMVRPELYERYVRLVRSIADDLGSVSSEEGLLHAYATGEGSAEEAALRIGLAPYAGLDLALARDAAFCLRHRELLGQLQRVEAHRRVERARAAGAEWVTVSEESSPSLPSPQRTVEMHVASGRAIHSFVELSPDTGRPTFGLELIRLDPMTGDWIREVDPVGREEVPDRTALRARVEALRRAVAQATDHKETEVERHGEGPTQGH
jgi:hypothetical protein